ncbi:MAG: hypothetical protein AAFZ38_05910 [Myxococcota bacterium]
MLKLVVLWMVAQSDPTVLQSWCDVDGALHLELGQAELVLRDQRPALATLTRQHRTRVLRTGRLFEGARPTDRVDYRGLDGTVGQLSIDANGWRLTFGGESRALKLPSGFRRGVPPLLLGVEGRHAWFVSPTHIARVDIASPKANTSVGRLNRRVLEWIFVAAGEKALFVDGRRVLSCEPNLRCREVGSLASPAEQVIDSHVGHLMATSDAVIKMILDEESDTQFQLEEVVKGRADAICAAHNHAWIALKDGESFRVVRLQGEKAPKSYKVVDLLEKAMPSSGANAAEAWADALVDARWPGRKQLGLAFADSKSSSLRKVAALIWGGEPGNASLARLWLLGHDQDLEVRISAVHASSNWCRRDTKMPCRAVLAAFINDPNNEVSWTARDLLLEDDPWAALEGAPASYRLEAVSRLSSRWAMRGEPRVLEVLERLSADADPSVRAAAQMAVIAD